MLHYRKACAYVINHQKQLLKEAAIERLLKARQSHSLSTRFIIWLSDVLIHIGLKLKSAYEVESATNINAPNYTQSG